MLSAFPQLFDYWMLGPLVLRVALAVVFIAHGYPKLFGLQNFAQFLSSLGIAPARFWAYVVALLECVGGILLLLGLFVQPVAALLIIEMLVAMWKVDFKKGFVGGSELPFVLLCMALALLFLGPGSLSIDLPL